MLLKLIPKKIKVWLLKRLYKDIAAQSEILHKIIKNKENVQVKTIGKPRS